MGVSKFPGEQHQHGEPAVESDNVFQDAGAADTLEIFPGIQEKVSHGVRYIRDNELPDQRQHSDEELPVERGVHVLGAAEKPGEHLQPDEERLQLRVRVDHQLAGRFAHEAADVPEEGAPGLRRFRQRFGREQLSEQHIPRLQSADVPGAVGKVHRLVGEILHLHGIELPASTFHRGQLEQSRRGHARRARSDLWIR